MCSDAIAVTCKGQVVVTRGKWSYSSARGRQDQVPHSFLTSPIALPVHAQRTRRSTPPRRALAGTQRSSSERTPKSESPLQRQETRCSTTKQGTLHKLASGAVAEGGWLSLGSSQLPRSTSDARLDSKNDINSWHPQQVKIELTQTSFATAESPRQQRIVTAAFHFCPPGQVEGQSATAKIQLESSSDIKYEQEATDFTVVRDWKASELFLLAVHCRGSKSSCVLVGYVGCTRRWGRTVPSMSSLRC